MREKSDRLFNFATEALGGLVVLVGTAAALLIAPVIGDWVNNGVVGILHAIGWLP